MIPTVMLTVFLALLNAGDHFFPMLTIIAATLIQFLVFPTAIALALLLRPEFHLAPLKGTFTLYFPPQRSFAS